MQTLQKIIPYITDHEISRVIISAAAEGLGVEPHLASSMAWSPEPSLVYGILRGCQDIIRKCRAINMEWWHIDLGYFGRGHYDGYYKLSRNGLQASGDIESPGIREIPSPEPWKSGTGPIVICPPTTLFALNHPYEKLDENDWTDSVRRAIESVTDRPTLVRDKKSHDGTPLGDPWCVVVHSSNIAIDALIAGTPVIALGDCLANDFCPNLSDIDDWAELRMVDREAILAIAAHTQFTLDEFRSGYAFELSRELQG